MTPVQEIREQAGKLTDREKAALVVDLLESLPAVLDDDDEGFAEAQRRDDELDRKPGPRNFLGSTPARAWTVSLNFHPAVQSDVKHALDYFDRAAARNWEIGSSTNCKRCSGESNGILLAMVFSATTFAALLCGPSHTMCSTGLFPMD